MPCRPGSSRESMLKRHSRRRNLKTGDSRGQALVEFSLVVLAFMTIFVGLIEFGIAFSVEMQINFASRDVATLAAESGGSPTTADCAILTRIDQDLMAPATRSNIIEVDIFWSTASGGVNGGAVETYTPVGQLPPSTCPTTLYWTNTQNSYPGTSRCAFIGGTNSGCLAGHTGPDTIGVTIVYKYTWSTPLPNLVPLAGTGFTFTQTNLTTMEPVPPLT